MEDTSKANLPRASTVAYRELRPLAPQNGVVFVQPPRGPLIPEDACAGALTDLRHVQSTLEAAVARKSLPVQLGAILNALLAALGTRSFSGASAALQSFRAECGQIIYALFHTNNKPHAQAASTMLAAVNATCIPLNLLPLPLPAPINADNGMTSASTISPTTSTTATPALRQQQFQSDTFFLPAESLTDILTISVDATLLAARTPSNAAGRPPLPPPPPPTVMDTTTTTATTTTAAAPAHHQHQYVAPVGQLPPRKRGRPPANSAHLYSSSATTTTANAAATHSAPAIPTGAAYTTSTASGGRGRGRGRGRGAGGGNNNNTGGMGVGFKRRPNTPSIWNSQLQRQLATAFRLILKPQSSPGPQSNEVEALTPLLLAFVEELSESGASAGMRMMGATLPNTCANLQTGAFFEPEEVLGAIGEEAHAAAEMYLTQENPDVRRGKITGTADSFCNLVGELLDRVLAELTRTAKAARLEMAAEAGITEEEMALAVARAEAARTVNVPLCIQVNREPYRNGDWRKTPFVPRPYVRLQEYFIVEEETRETIERKLKTRKQGGCSGQHCSDRAQLGTYSLENECFSTPCSCLSRNTECDANCACATTAATTGGGGNACLNRAVTNRAAVVLGEDVQEINSWGMDCYTRRNIQDAVLESQVFGQYAMPNYKAILAKLKAGVPPSRAAATAAGQHAAVAADSPAAASAVAAASEIGAAATVDEHEYKANNNKDEQGDVDMIATTPAPPAPPAPQTQIKSRAAIERCVVEWIERTLVPAINRQGDNGWDLREGLADVKARALAAQDTTSLAAAQAVEARLNHVGYNYFRIHPKGVGLTCRRPGGLPHLTFVEEYLGEIHTPHRWFELQDAVKKITGDELPDFYNIALERPRDDPDGYDILFVDAAAKGAHASRMSHSCTPNCQAVVMACGGRLTIALYTLRHVYEGEELTFDYSSVTESEKEFRDAICLCGTHMCRGSYLYFTGSRAFMQVMTRRHNLLHRQAILCRSGMEAVTDVDRERLRRYGIGNSCLGTVERGDRVAPWLEKWAALICEYLEVEEACLREELVANDQYNMYTAATAGAEAKGVVANRVQNIAITLDKVRAFLAHPGQPAAPVLRPLTDEETVDHLWRGPRSVGKRLLKGAIGSMGASASTVRTLQTADSDATIVEAVNGIKSSLSPSLKQLCTLGTKSVTTPAAARKNLQALVDALRVVDMEVGGGLTAAADIGQLYASTQRWVTCEREYKSVLSKPVPINLQDLFLNREATQLALPSSITLVRQPPPVATVPPVVAPIAGPPVAVTTEKTAGVAPPSPPSVTTTTIVSDPGAPPPPPLARTPEEEAAAVAAATRHANAMAKRNKNNPALKKQYRPSYLWGQLNGWFKQTVSDPTASLSAERRGTMSLPDIESCFGGKSKVGGYGPKQRYELLDNLEKRPDSMWKVGTQWSFKNDNKVYGGPMLDSAWSELVGEGVGTLPAAIKKLRGAALPFEMPTSARGSGGGGAKRARGKKGSKKGSSSAYADDDDDEDEGDDIDGLF